MPLAINVQEVSKGFVVKSSLQFGWRGLLGLKEPRREVLNKISFDLAPSERLLIVGPNGIGKTTLLKVAGGFLRPDKGRVLIEGRPAHRFDRTQFGLMLSTQLLYPTLTCFQNLEFSAYLFGLRNVKRAVEKAAEEWGIKPFLHDLVQSCSNGQRTLVALARATIHAPQLLLFDEPNAFLDDTNRTIVANFFRETKASAIITVQQSELPHWKNVRVVTL